MTWTIRFSCALGFIAFNGTKVKELGSWEALKRFCYYNGIEQPKRNALKCQCTSCIDNALADWCKI